MEKEKIKFRNALISDSNDLSNLESEIFPLDKVNTNFFKEINKENKKIFICSYKNLKKEKFSFSSKIKQIILKISFHFLKILADYHGRGSKDF